MVIVKFQHCTDNPYGITRISWNPLVKRITHRSPLDHDIDIDSDFKTACIIIEFTYGSDDVFPHIYSDGKKRYIVTGTNDIQEYVPPVVNIRY